MAAAHKMDSITTSGSKLQHDNPCHGISSAVGWRHSQPGPLQALGAEGRRGGGRSCFDLLLSFPQLLSAMVSPDWMTQVRKIVRSGVGREPGSSFMGYVKICLFKTCLLHHYEPHLL